MNEWPPPPGVGEPFGHVDEVEVEAHYSPDNFVRVVISRDKVGHLRVHPQAWAIYDHEVERLRAAYWSPLEQMATITDTIENARKLAFEQIEQLRADDTSDV